jgi:hypothetical protein
LVGRRPWRGGDPFAESRQARGRPEDAEGGEITALVDGAYVADDRHDDREAGGGPEGGAVPRFALQMVDGRTYQINHTESFSNGPGSRTAPSHVPEGMFAALDTMLMSEITIEGSTEAEPIG